jgi:NADPH-dependent 2,4-dienoyl-CoA reductase/sulfur reductase-like enzyme
LKLVIVGGSDAGISAALRARELDRNVAVSVLLADAFPNYSICGLPFFLSGETPDWHDLAHRKQFDGIEILTGHRASSIDLTSKTVFAETNARQQINVPYDRLVIATGATPVVPNITGWNLPGVYHLHTMGDAFAVGQHIDQMQPKSAVIVGAGYIGVEMADALTHRGIKVTLMGRSPVVFPSVDPELGEIIDGQLKRSGVEVVNSANIRTISRDSGALMIEAEGGVSRTADIVLVVVGVRPNSDIAKAAGIETGGRGAIVVNRRMETSVPDVYAAGDCVETWHRLLQRYAYLPLGTTSHKQGRTAGENAVGGDSEFAGSVGTQVVKIFEIAVARTGLLHKEAIDAGFRALTTESKSWDHKAYYPGAKEMHIRVTGDRVTGKLLGAQLVGNWKSEVAKRVDIFATALFHGMAVEGINDLDLSYTPPLSSPWDPVQMAVQDWARELLIRHK